MRRSANERLRCGSAIVCAREVGRTDRVRIVHDVGPAVLVPAHGERQAEGEDQADHPEQGSLEHPDGLAIRLRVPPEVTAGEHAEGGCAAYDSENEKPEFPAAQGEEHDPLKLWRRTDGA